MSDLVGNPEDRFSRVAAQMITIGKSICHELVKVFNSLDAQDH